MIMIILFTYFFLKFNNSVAFESSWSGMVCIVGFQRVSTGEIIIHTSYCYLINHYKPDAVRIRIVAKCLKNNFSLILLSYDH